jgi:hypothetical protein
MCSCFRDAFLIAVHRHGVKLVSGIRLGVEVLIQRHATIRVHIPKQINDRKPGLGVQIVRTIWSSGSPVGWHLDGHTDLAPKYHVVVLARERCGLILTSSSTLLLRPSESRFASSTSLTSATYLVVSQVSIRPQMISWTLWNWVIPPSLRRMTTWNTNGRSEFQRR